jgi:hypothetical protein
VRVVGIDLAGSEKRNTGFCILNEKLNCETKILHTDEEIIEEVEKTKPQIISIDAPLSLPKGRKNLEDKSGPHFRECDRELAKMHIKFFPITLGPMRKLTKRGIKLKLELEKRGYKVIETFPGAAQDILNIPRKQRGLEKLRKSLLKLGIKKIKRKISGDELDAITCALVGKMFLEGNYLAIGNKSEGLIILPKV